MIMPKYRTCFVCGPENDRGLNQTFISDGDTVTTEFTPVANICGYTGILHGGITASLLDETMGWTAFERAKRYFLTAELTIRYKKPILLGKTYTVKAELGTLRKKLYSATGEIVDSDGTVYATGSAKYILTNPVDKNDYNQIVFDEE